MDVSPLPDVYPVQVQGPSRRTSCATLVGDAVLDVKYYWTLDAEIDGIPVVISRTGWTGEVGYEVYLRDPSRGDDLWDAIMEAGGRTTSGRSPRARRAASRPASSTTART